MLSPIWCFTLKEAKITKINVILMHWNCSHIHKWDIVHLMWLIAHVDGFHISAKFSVFAVLSGDCKFEYWHYDSHPCSGVKRGQNWQCSEERRDSVTLDLSNRTTLANHALQIGLSSECMLPFHHSWMIVLNCY